MLRLYDARAGRTEAVTPARPGELRILTGAPPSTDRSYLDRVRTWLVADVIRRGAARHGLAVTVCELVAADESAAADGWHADRTALNIYPAEHSVPADLPMTAIVELLAPGRSHRRGAAPPSTPAFDILVAAGDPSATDPSVARHVTALVAPVTGTLVTGDSATGEPATGVPATSDTSNGDTGTERAAGGGTVAEDGAGRSPVGADASSDPLALRLALLRRGYRDPLHLDADALRAAGHELLRWRARVAEWARSPSTPIAGRYAGKVVAAFDDDLDTPRALRALRALEADETERAGTKFETFAALDRLLGLDLASTVGW